MSIPRRPLLTSVPQQRLAMFVDVDGVMHSTTASDQLEALVPMAQDARRVAFVRGTLHPRAFGMLEPQKQDLLAAVLQRHPHVVIVISSAWRHWQGYHWADGEVPDPVWEREHVATLNWLKRLLHPVVADRIIGKTGQVHQTISDYLNRPATRLDEIRAYMQEHGPALGLANNWVAVDDQARHFAALDSGVFHDVQGMQAQAGVFPAEAVLLVDGVAALTDASATALDAALQRASARLCAGEAA
jgi:hypothetical protein